MADGGSDGRERGSVQKMSIGGRGRSSILAMR